MPNELMIIIVISPVGCNSIGKPVQLHLSSPRLLPSRLLRAAEAQLFQTGYSYEENIPVNRR